MSGVPQLFSSSGDHSSCPANSPISCSASGVADSCCYEGTNGLFLQTQFWDYNPATGPDDVWTIHGLWSDKCSGGYQQFCNPSWQVQSAQQTLEGLGLTDLVSTMGTYWKNQGSKGDDDLWTHEFNKHGTCMSTVSPSCYSSGQPNENVGDFFKRVVDLWETLPSYKWLSEAGITPSTDQTWTVEQFSDALSPNVNNATVYLGCDRNNAINEIWYFFSLRGSVADGEFENIDSISTSSCTDGFYYLPKGHSGGSGGGDGDDNAPSTRGQLSVIPDGSSSSKGCLISDGSWFTSGTCATYTASETVGGISLKSSRGPCGIVDGAFKCGGKVTPSDFELNEKNQLTYGGDSEWSAKSSPASNQKIPVSPGSGSVSFGITFG